MNRLNYFDSDLAAMSHLQGALIAKWLSLCKCSLQKNGKTTGKHNIADSVKDQFQLALLPHCTDIRKLFFGGVWWAMAYTYHFGFSFAFVLIAATNTDAKSNNSDAKMTFTLLVCILAATLLLSSVLWFRMRCKFGWSYLLGDELAAGLAKLRAIMQIFVPSCPLIHSKFATAYADDAYNIIWDDIIKGIFDIYYHRMYTIWAMKAFGLAIVYSFWITGPEFVDPMGVGMPTGTFLALLGSVGQLCDATVQLTNSLLRVFRAGGRIEQVNMCRNVRRHVCRRVWAWLQAYA